MASAPSISLARGIAIRVLLIRVGCLSDASAGEFPCTFDARSATTTSAAEYRGNGPTVTPTDRPETGSPTGQSENERRPLSLNRLLGMAEKGISVEGGQGFRRWSRLIRLIDPIR